MIRKLLPVLLALGGLGAGLGAGLTLRPPQPGGEEDGTGAGTGHENGGKANEASGHDTGKTEEHAAVGEGATEFVKLNNQFVVPVVEDGRVGSLVILSLSLQVPTGTTNAVYAREPKLRDRLLQVMFDHANTGGFRGTFTETAPMLALRRALLETAQSVLGADAVSDVMIVDIVRQDS